MARFFTSGTSTDGGGSVATNAASLQSLIRDAILLHSNWSLVEEFNGSSATFHNTVFKCAASGSGLPKDFYVVFSRTIATGNMLVAVGEDYDSSTHTLTNATAGNLASTRAIDGSGLPTSTPTWAFGANQVQTNTPGFQSYTPTASSSWGVAVDTDHFAFWTGSAIGVFCGAFTSLVQGISDPMPLCMVRLSGSSAAGGATSPTNCTRQPGVTTPAPSNAFQFDEPLLPAIFQASTSVVPFTSVDKYQNNKTWAYNIRLSHSSTNMATAGLLRGKLPKCAYINTAPSGVTSGDTFSIDGTTWVVMAFAGQQVVVVDTGA